MRVLVIGGGMAGTAAALAARSAGAEVTLVRGAPGATALCSGLVEVARGGGGGGEAAGGSPCEAALALARRSPAHPYATIEGHLGRLDEALEAVGQALGGFFAPTRGGWLVDPLGGLHSAPFAFGSQARGVIAGGARVGVAWFRSQPRWIEGELLSASLREAGVDAVAVPIDPLLRASQLTASPFALAAWLDDPGEARKLGQSVARALGPDRTLVLLPPFVGLERPAEALSLVAAEAGVACGEILAGTPSVPGLRLQRALDRALAAAGVVPLTSEVAEVSAGRAVLAGDGRVLPFEEAILATGSYLGGGLRRSEAFTEPLLGLPVWDGERVLDGDLPETVIGGGPGSPAAAFRAGVRIDGGLHPLDRSGRPIAWLRAAGAILGGADAAVDGAGLGFAAFTGFLAGRLAAEGAGSPQPRPVG